MHSSLYIQTDGKIFVQGSHSRFPYLRLQLHTFSTLMESQDPIYVYRVTPQTLWQAASSGKTPREVLGFLRSCSDQPIPLKVQQLIVSEMTKWGQFKLTRVSPKFVQLTFAERWNSVITNLAEIQEKAEQVFANRVTFPIEEQGFVKQVLARHEIPVEDLVEYEDAPSLKSDLKMTIGLRGYQQEAVQSFFGDGINQSGVVVLPCGSGKTIVGLAILTRLSKQTLIVTPSDVSAQQWQQEVSHCTTLDATHVSIYSPRKPVAPVTITTYQRISGKNKRGEYRHLKRLVAEKWGLVIYDEVHLLPAPLFRLAAELQSSRRLGLTATLVREDGRESDVYSLIGPKSYDGDWRELEEQGYLASVQCVELRIPLPVEERGEYGRASRREQHRIAALNSKKIQVVGRLMERHRDQKILIIGHYLKSLKDIALRYGIPLITGSTPSSVRNQLYEAFRSGAEDALVLSRVANMAVNLPEASVGIQVSGLFGSRQEEAQRLGRLLRPSSQGGWFYSLVSANTVEEETARKRQRFLVEQGYTYDIETTTN
ncbi:DNA repair helicase XPB [Alicyclobacillus sp. SO9]|uniref:DNA repair helicase XPB n=1 Tax=Alicyclobacillus sp. SO9 TaxID=2665646 RepID=UPI0018E81185|nr:DNA repair helicase XPB [Alicyclobacillus sp. SO9]QQE76794.1 helicase-associated domain-containing protein [Alicyclobacillus sp. SO9]